MKPCRFDIDVSILASWLREHPRRDYILAKILGRSRDPEDRRKVLAIYRQAKRLRALGFDVVVDHIEPLCSDWVCGLHHSANLRIVDAATNKRKGNGADHPELDLEYEPHQTRLEL